MAERLNSIADIARIAGVSKSTVSRALDDSPLISVETKERIRDIARDHGFHRNDVARRLSLGQSRVIGLLTHPYAEGSLASTRDSFVLELLGGISVGLRESGYDLLLIQASGRDTDWVSQYLDAGRVDGFVLMAPTCSRRQLDTLVKAGAPFVMWGGAPAERRTYSTVTGDSLAGGRMATEHLLGLGRRSIAFIGGPARQSEAQDRYHGYESALRAAGRALDPRLVEHGDYSPPSAATAMALLFDRTPDLDAVFVISDLMAIAAMDEIRSRGLRIPEDVAVVGYDDIAVARYTNPPLTTISQNVPLAGKLLAQSLVQQIDDGTVTSVSIPAALVVRSSA
jgi:DNA-binding LacI/PurR family transcriptional regulator